MGIVTDILTSLDNSIRVTGELFFENTAHAMTPVLSIMMTLMLSLVAMNMALGVWRMSARDATQLATRILMVYLFALSWRNFGSFYEALSSASGNLALSFFDRAGDTGRESTYAAMDLFALQMGDTADGVLRGMGSIARSVLGATTYLMLAVLMAAYVLIVGFAKIMIAVLLGIAPLAIIMTLFDKTKSLFEAWLSSFVGYLMYPIAAAAVVATVVTLANQQAVAQEDVSSLDQILGFLVIAIVGIGALWEIRTAATNITGQIHLASFAPQALRMGNRTAGLGGRIGQAGIAGVASAAGMATAGAALAHPAAAAAGALGTLPTAMNQRSAREAGSALRQKLGAISMLRR